MKMPWRIAHTRGDAAAQAKYDLLTPFRLPSVPAFLVIAALGVQVHGGMGFIETGAAQHVRDAHSDGYEGANGIQAMDLWGANAARQWRSSARLYWRNARTAEMSPVKPLGFDPGCRRAGDAIDALKAPTGCWIAQNPAHG